MNRQEVMDYLQQYGEIEANQIDDNDVLNALLREGSQKRYGSGSTCKQPDERKPDDVVGIIRDGRLLLTFRRYTLFQKIEKKETKIIKSVKK